MGSFLLAIAAILFIGTTDKAAQFRGLSSNARICLTAILARTSNDIAKRPPPGEANSHLPFGTESPDKTGLPKPVPHHQYPNSYRYIELETGYAGQARVNPFLAAMRFLREMGVETEQRFGVTEMPDRDFVLFVPSDSVDGGRELDRLLEWTSEGGHLVYLHSGTDSFQNDFSGYRRLNQWERETASNDAEDKGGEKGEDEIKKEEEERRDRFWAMYPLMKALHVEPGERENKTSTVQLKDAGLEIEIPGSLGFDVPAHERGPEDYYLGGPRNARSFITFRYKEGRITLLSNALCWRNRFINKRDHAQFLWELVNLDGKPVGAWILRGMDLSFWSLLWQYGWMPILSLGVFLTFWLWRCIPRFGPLLPLPAPATREFTTHLSMAGGFLWSRRCIEALLAPVRRRVLRTHQRKYMLAKMPTAEEAASALSEASGLTEDQVLHAFNTFQLRDINQLTDLLRDLQKLDQTQ